MCLAALQQDLAEEIAERDRLAAVLQNATHKKYDETAKQYAEHLELIDQIERDIKMLRRLETV